MSADFNKAVSVAKILLMRHSGTMFLSTVCCSLETVTDENISFAATNGKVIKINPNSFMQLTVDERVFLLAHETMHIVYKHTLRIAARDPELWNYSADYLINSELVNQGFTMIKGGLYDTQYDGLSTDEIYSMLASNSEQSKSKGKGNPLDGDMEKLPEGIAESDVEEDIDNIIISASQLCDMRDKGGSVPESVRRYLTKLTAPKVNWKVVLRRFMQALDRSDYSWSRPNKRYQDMYLPHMRGEAISQISFAIDTSGSVSEDEFKQFISEVHNVMTVMKPESLQLMQFDHKLQSDQIIKSARELAQVSFKGHGGTDPSVALNSFMNSKSVALIMLTDGQFYTERLPKPKRPVLWVIFDNPNWVAPYGKVIHIEINKRR